MPFTVLIADDHPHTRQLIRRVLSRDFDVRLLEAEHGVEVLERLVTERVDLLLLDISMPIMTGLETLEAIRRAGDYGSLPVLILAGQAEEQQVMQLMQLGIAGFLVKPFRPALLTERVARLLSRARLGTQDGPLASPRRLDLRRASRVLVVDRAPEFCQMFAQQLASLCRVDSAHTLSSAIAQCADSPPAVVFVGALDRLLEVEVLVRKLRLSFADPAPILMGLLPIGHDDQGDGAPFDGVLPRTYVPSLLRSALQAVFSDATNARWILAPEGELVSAFAEQARTRLGRGVRTELVGVQRRPAWASSRSRWVVVSLEMQVQELAWDLRLQLPYGTALAFASARTGVTPDAVSSEGLATAWATEIEELGAAFSSLASASALPLRYGQGRVAESAAYVARDSRVGSEPGAHWWFTDGDERGGVALGLVPLSERRSA